MMDKAETIDVPLSPPEGDSGKDGENTPPLTMDSLVEIKRQKQAASLRLGKKREILRKLEMVKMYRTKNDLGHLGELIDKWRAVVRDGLQELHGLTSDPRPSLTQLVDHFQLDHTLIGYNAEEEEFAD